MICPKCNHEMKQVRNEKFLNFYKMKHYNPPLIALFYCFDCKINCEVLNSLWHKEVFTYKQNDVSIFTTDRNDRVVEGKNIFAVNQEVSIK